MSLPVVTDRKNIRQRIMFAQLITGHPDIDGNLFNIYILLVREQFISERINTQLILADTEYINVYIRNKFVDILAPFEFYNNCINVLFDHANTCIVNGCNIGYTIMDDVFIVNVNACNCGGDDNETNFILDITSARKLLRILFDNNCSQRLCDCDGTLYYLFFVSSISM